MEGARALVEEPSLAYKPWIGSLVEYLDIRNDFENETTICDSINAGRRPVLR